MDFAAADIRDPETMDQLLGNGTKQLFMNNNRKVFFFVIDPNPFKKYDEWKAFDTVYGHNCYETLAVLGSFGLLQSRLTKAEFEQHVVNTMNELIENDPLGIYIKVWEDTEIKPVDLEKI